MKPLTRGSLTKSVGDHLGLAIPVTSLLALACGSKEVGRNTE